MVPFLTEPVRLKFVRAVRVLRIWLQVKLLEAKPLKSEVENNVTEKATVLCSLHRSNPITWYCHQLRSASAARRLPCSLDLSAKAVT